MFWVLGQVICEPRIYLGRSIRMSDDKSTPEESTHEPAQEPTNTPAQDTVGAPVAEEPAVDDVVGSARESLADAEAAGRPDAVVAEDAAPETAAAAPAEGTVDDAAAAQTTVQPVAETVVVAETPASPADQPVEAAAAAGAAAGTAHAQPQPIFVQAPEAPLPRGNRAAAGAIGLLAALSFGVLYLVVGVVVGLIEGTVTPESVGTAALNSLSTWALWVPVVVFFISFWLLGAIINRGRWGGWVIFGLLVGAAAYGGHILGQLFEAPFWTLTAQEGAQLAESQLLTPMAIAAFILGRELTIWFGAWAAARGKRMTELNVEARREYERTLEAGPQLQSF